MIPGPLENTMKATSEMHLSSMSSVSSLSVDDLGRVRLEDTLSSSEHLLYVPIVGSGRPPPMHSRQSRSTRLHVVRQQGSHVGGQGPSSPCSTP